MGEALAYLTLAAPRIDAPHWGQPWLEANAYVYTPFNVTAGPAVESLHFGGQAALTMAARLPRDHRWDEQPANVFGFPGRD